MTLAQIKKLKVGDIFTSEHCKKQGVYWKISYIQGKDINLVYPDGTTGLIFNDPVHEKWWTDMKKVPKRDHKKYPFKNL